VAAAHWKATPHRHTVASTHALQGGGDLCSIDERLSEPRLDPERLAREQGVSRRRLDELFVPAPLCCLAQAWRARLP